MESKQYIKKQEKNDANNVVMRGFIYSWIPLLCLAYTHHTNMILLIIILLIILLIKNYVDIYIKYKSKYKTGNSYLKRKFRSIGLCVTIYNYVTFYITYLISFYNRNIALVFYVITIFIIILTAGLLVNVLWYKFDLKRYKEIDLQNPKQKRYTTQ